MPTRQPLPATIISHGFTGDSRRNRSGIAAESRRIAKIRTEGFPESRPNRGRIARIRDRCLGVDTVTIGALDFFINAVLVWPSLWGDFDLMDVLESSRGVVAVRAPQIWFIPSRMYRPSTDKFWTSIRPQSLPVGSQALILENKALLNICDVFS